MEKLCHNTNPFLQVKLHCDIEFSVPTKLLSRTHAPVVCAHGLSCTRPGLSCSRPGLSCPQGLLPWPSSVATQARPSPKPYCDTKFLSRHRISVATQGRTISVATKKAHIATQTTQLAWEQCRNMEIPITTQNQKALLRALCCHERILAARACLSRALRPGYASDLRTMSRHGKPCCDIVSKKPCRDREYSVATQTWNWAVVHPFFLPCTSKLLSKHLIPCYYPQNIFYKQLSFGNSITLH